MVGLVILLIIIFVILLCDAIVRKYKKDVLKVKEHSNRYKDILKLNMNYQFNFEINKNITIEKKVNNKPKFDKFNFEKAIYSEIKEKLSFYQNIQQCIYKNIELDKSYVKEYYDICSDIYEINTKKLRISTKKFIKIEGKICYKARLYPITDIDIKLVVNYTSPQGVNSYSKNKHYNHDDLKQFIIEIERNIEYEKTEEHRRKIERSKISASKRVEILQRDKGRCRLCGRSVKEGAVLHVDHITPISKGGKSTDDNLQTLCQDCNLGKGDKIYRNF